MILTDKIETFPSPPEDLAFDTVRLKFDRLVPADTSRGLAPFYHFRILIGSNQDAGHINFRIGDTDHIRLYAGHIGYKVDEAFRGHGVAFQACRAISRFVGSIYKTVIITIDLDNLASIRTIERLGAKFLNEVTLPPNDPRYQPGGKKKRYEWSLEHQI